MPHANIWIRRSNQAAWDALDNKSDWINSHLKDTTSADDDYSPKSQVEAAGYVFIEIDDDGQVHCRDRSGEDYYFDVKYGKVIIG